MTRVYYLLSEYPNLTQTFVAREIAALRKAGVQVETFSLKKPSTLDRTTTYAPFLPSCASTVVTCFRQPATVCSLVAAVVKDLRRLRVRVVLANLRILMAAAHFAAVMRSRGCAHVHSHFVWGGGTAAWMVSKLCGCTFSITAHAFDIYDERMRDGLYRKKLSDASFVATIAEFNRQTLLAEMAGLRDKLHVVRCGIDMPVGGERAVGKRDAAVTVLSVARLTEKKGLRYLLEALEILRRDEPAIRFRTRIIGDGEDRESLTASAQRLGVEVSFLGATAVSCVLEQMDEADLFVLPCVVTSSGDRDGIPVVLMEAMAKGLAVISTPVTGIPELVRDGRSGLLVPERDARALANAMRLLAEDPVLRLGLGREAQRAVRLEYTVAKTAETLKRLFMTCREANESAPTETSLAGAVGQL
jgi:glycosyltransferase involved in cell wall biosynthesis